MTNKVTLPADRSWVAVADGTQGAWVTGAAQVFIGATAPTADSAFHNLPADGITVNSPAKMWARSPSTYAAVITVSNW